MTPAGRQPRRRRRRAEQAAKSAAPGGISGGRYRPLNQQDLARIDRAARAILTDIGMAEAPEVVIEAVSAAGGHVDNSGRLRFSSGLIEDALAGLARGFTLCGRDPAFEMRLGDARVHLGSGGAAPLILDLDRWLYRESMLCDLYDAARLADCLDNIHFFSRPPARAKLSRRGRCCR